MSPRCLRLGKTHLKADEIYRVYFLVIFTADIVFPRPLRKILHVSTSVNVFSEEANEWQYFTK